MTKWLPSCRWRLTLPLAAPSEHFPASLTVPLHRWLFPPACSLWDDWHPVIYNLVNLSYSSCYGNLRENRSVKQWVGRRNILPLSPFLLQPRSFVSKMPPSQLTHRWLCCILSSCPNSVKTHVKQSFVFCLVIMLQCRDFLVILHLAI